mgnify:CR=1
MDDGVGIDNGILTVSDQKTYMYMKGYEIQYLLGVKVHIIIHGSSVLCQWGGCWGEGSFKAQSTYLVMYV